MRYDVYIYVIRRLKVNMEISMEHSLNDTDRRKLNSWDNIYFVYHVRHKNWF